MTNDKTQKALVLLYCFLMMLILGISDGLRGVFLPLFERTYELDSIRSSVIIMCSYVGNLLFLLLGGRILDRMSKKRFLFALTFIWMAALLFYIFTEHYWILLGCIIFSLGASTMLSTSLNIITPLFFTASAMYVNLFNFAQGVGMFTAQNIGGRFAEHMSGWHGWNAVLLGCGVLSLFVLAGIRFPQTKPAEKKPSTMAIFRNPAAKYLIPLFGFYYIAEHGLQNWMVTYGSSYLGFSTQQAALYLSLFFGGITVGRLLFAPLVQKMGVLRSMAVFTVIGTLLYVAGILFERSGIALLCLSGLAFSIIYPTLVVVVGKYYAPEENGTAVGLIAGISTVFDIAFNIGFGTLVEAAGFAIAIKVLPVAMIGFCAVYLVMQKRVKPLEH